MGLFFHKSVQEALNRGKVVNSYLVAAGCFLLIVGNIAAFLFFPKITAPLAIVLSNAVTILLMLLAFRPLNHLLQRSLEQKAKDYVAQEKELQQIKDTVTSLENRNRELESRLDTWSQMASVPPNVNFTFKVETMTYDKSGYIVKEESLDKFANDPSYRLSDKKGVFDRISKWVDDVMHPGQKKVLYIGKFYAKASIGIDFTKIKFAVREEGISLFGVRFTKLNDLAVKPEQDDVNLCWLLNEDELGISLHSSELYTDFIEAYTEIRERESEQALEDEVSRLCDSYTAIFRQNLTERFPGISFCDHIEDSDETWYSLKEHIQDKRIYPIASNMFLMADVLSGTADMKLPALT